MSGLKNFDDDLIAISSIASYTFCPRRYYLLNIECNNTNYGNELTAKGKAEHQTVHEAKIERRKSLIIVHDMQVFSKSLGIIGNCDTVEFYKTSTGSYVPFLNGTYEFTVVEHKRKEIEWNDCDIMQITAQTMCLEEMYNTIINQAYIYYSTTNKKVSVDITNENRKKLKDTIEKIRQTELLSEAPPVIFLKSCKNCAAYTICNPQKYNVSKYIELLWRHL